jgi:hypothetical protein
MANWFHAEDRFQTRRTIKIASDAFEASFRLPGLPDFSWYNVQNEEKYTKLQLNFKLVIKYTRWP